MPGIIDALAELTVVGSYGNAGFERRSRRFDPADLDVDLHGRTAVVTGASSGIGLVIATELARRGARVCMVARDTPRLAAAHAVVSVAAATPPVACPADLSDLDQVDDLALRIAALTPTLEILVHNAGVLIDRAARSPQGIEYTLATNVVGPFALHARLDPMLRAADAARVVTVTSGGMYTQRLRLDRLTGAAPTWDGVVAYAQTKRAQVVLNRLWARRYEGTRVVAHAMHPGWADTPGVASSLPRFYRLARPILRTAEQGADTALWLCVADEPTRSSGRLWLDRAARREHVLWHTRAGDALDRDLWSLCLALARVNLPGAP